MSPETSIPLVDSNKKKDRSKWKIIAILVVLLLISAAAAVYLYMQNVDIRQNPNKLAEEELNKTVERVGKLILLPDGEKPTLATVTDPIALKNQPFFAKAKMGDQVLLYAGARKAILYDPVANKIVEVASLNLGSGSQ